MRIEAYTKLQQVYKSQRTGRNQKADASRHADRLQISSLGKEFQTAKTALAESADVREELVVSLKEKLQKGTYQVSNESFAEKLLNKYEELR